MTILEYFYLRAQYSETLIMFRTWQYCPKANNTVIQIWFSTAWLSCISIFETYWVCFLQNLFLFLFFRNCTRQPLHTQLAHLKEHQMQYHIHFTNNMSQRIPCLHNKIVYTASSDVYKVIQCYMGIICIPHGYHLHTIWVSHAYHMGIRMSQKYPACIIK